MFIIGTYVLTGLFIFLESIDQSSSISGDISDSNILLSKPARQQQTFNGIGAPRAVDGNPDQTGFACARNDELGTWWMCDMQNFYIVDKVVVTGRDTEVLNLNRFIVGLSTYDYVGSDVVKGSYHICARYPNPASIPPMTVFCNPPTPLSKYLIVQQPTNRGYLVICEIEAYVLATLERTRWQRMQGYYQRNFQVGRLVMRSGMECMLACLGRKQCWSASRSTSGDCILSARSATSVLVQDEAWNYYLLF